MIPTSYTIGGAILGVVLYTGVVFYYGSEHGEAKVSQELATYVATQTQLAAEAETKRTVAETKLQGLNTKYEQSLSEIRKEYEANAANTTRAHNRRVQQLQARADSYRLMSEAGSLECRALADTATELDRTLIEGRQLVGELRQEVALRNKQLEVIGEQIRAERTYGK